MIHIVTVHCKDDHWIDIQLNYFKEYIKQPYKVYAFLNYLPKKHQDKYFYSSTEDIKSHAIKLNLLADMATLHSNKDDDWIIFIDGDAFPVADIVSFGKEKLKKHPLIAIQRKENYGDIQPHPSFCLTTIGFWKKIDGDWNSGYEWENPSGKKITDVGGNLLSILDKQGIKWLPILRSNKRNIHKLWFGVYGNLVYHHGAGFRAPVSRVDMQDHSNKYSSLLKKIYLKIKKENTKKTRNEIAKKNTIASNKVYQSILNDKYFFQYFLEEPVDHVREFNDR